MHPITSDRIRSLLARTKLSYIISGYVLITLIAALILALFYRIGDANSLDYLKWWQYSITQLLSAEPPADFSYKLNSFQNIVFICGSILGVVLPALFFGAIVFRLFIHKNMLVFRKNMLIYFSPSRKTLVLAIVMYNSSKLRIVNGNIKIYLKRLTTELDGKLNVTNVLVEDRPISTISYHRYNSVIIPLDKTDVQLREKSKYTLISVKGLRIEQNTELRLIISGSIPELGTDMVEDFSYFLPNNLQWGYRENIIDDQPNPSKSNSWKRFEDVTNPFEIPSDYVDVVDVN
jgi:hypothetical protein